MKKKTAVIIIVVVIILSVITILRFVVGGDEDSWICDNGQWIEHGNPTRPKPDEKCD